MSSSYQQEEVQDLLNYDAFPSDIKRLQGLECLAANGPGLNKPVSYIECFEKADPYEYLEKQREECSTDEHPETSRYNKAPNLINKDQLPLQTSTYEDNIGEKSVNGQLQDAQNPPVKMQKESSSSQEQVKMFLDLSNQENISKVTATFQENSQKVLNERAADNVLRSSDDDKENQMEFSTDYGHKGKTDVYETSGTILRHKYIFRAVGEC